MFGAVTACDGMNGFKIKNVISPIWHFVLFLLLKETISPFFF